MTEIDSPSLQQPLLIPANDRESVLLNDYSWIWEDEKRKQTYRVTACRGFTTDLASVPRLFWTLSGYLPDGLYRGAAVMHDLLYQWQGLPQAPAGRLESPSEDHGWALCLRRLSRHECDRLFLAMMDALGTGRIKRRLVYWSVRCFGWLAWSR